MNIVLYCTAWGLEKTLKDLYFSPGTVKVKIQVFWMRQFVSEHAIPDILKDCSALFKVIQKNPIRCNSVSKFIVPYLYEAQHVSGDTPPIIRNRKLH